MPYPIIILIVSAYSANDHASSSERDAATTLAGTELNFHSTLSRRLQANHHVANRINLFQFLSRKKGGVIRRRIVRVSVRCRSASRAESGAC